jgi:hypothetical protein
MEEKKDIKVMSEFKESELMDVSNHLERLRNEKFNPQIDAIGQMLSNNLEILRNTKKNLDKKRSLNNGPQCLEAKSLVTNKRFQIEVDAELVQDNANKVFEELFRMKVPPFNR